MTMTDIEQTTQATTTRYHFVLTASFQEPMGVKTNTTSGTFDVPAGSEFTRSKAFEQAIELIREQNEAPEPTPMNTVFWSLEPDEL